MRIVYFGREAKRCWSVVTHCMRSQQSHLPLATCQAASCLFICEQFSSYVHWSWHIHLRVWCNLNFIPFTLEITYCETRLKATRNRNVSISAYGLLDNIIWNRLKAIDWNTLWYWGKRYLRKSWIFQRHKHFDLRHLYILLIRSLLLQTKTRNGGKWKI